MHSWIDGITIPFPESVAQKRHYFTYTSLENDFLAGDVSADSIRNLVCECLNMRLAGIRGDFSCKPELQRLVEQAYPDESGVECHAPSEPNDAQSLDKGSLILSHHNLG
ncbi:unnamed protein product [Protopolystoma xenopodis]|uniref:Uncharacterized protein n=1 Tax=Protopolystoma xenopodis TaxID=117903 RepID=A0A3S5CQX3_9PLAT|nr:unnamed protein product [Protopolystoma xenopodis]